jgi:hypothetical protein
LYLVQIDVYQKNSYIIASIYDKEKEVWRYILFLPSKREIVSGMVVHVYNPITQEAKEGNLKSEACPGYIARLSLKKPKINKQIKEKQHKFCKLLILKIFLAPS